jgi:DNA-binding beta-propeller fold protein YncE
MRRLGCLLAMVGALVLPGTVVAADGCIGRIGCPYTSVTPIPNPVLAYAVATDAAGNIYLTDPGGAQVYRLNSAGTLNGNWFSSSGNSILYGVAVTPDGSQIFTVDAAGDQVLAFDGTNPNSSETAKLVAGQLQAPFGIALDGNTLDIADSGNRRILQINTQGTVTGQVETLLLPDWPAIDPQGDVWAVSQPLAANADEAPPAIAEFSPTLQPLDQSTLPLAAVPGGAAIDSVGDLFISDTANDLILQYGASGTLVNYFGGTGSAPGAFTGPLGVAVDGSDNLYVVDSSNNRIEKFALANVAQALATDSRTPVLGGRAPVTVRCLARGIPTCEGKLTLTQGGKTVGSQTYSVADDKSEAVKVALNHRARHRLAERGKLKVKAFARTHSRPGTQDRVTAEVVRLHRVVKVCGGGASNGRCTPPHP